MKFTYTNTISLEIHYYEQLNRYYLVHKCSEHEIVTRISKKEAKAIQKGIKLYIINK